MSVYHSKNEKPALDVIPIPQHLRDEFYDYHHKMQVIGENESPSVNRYQFWSWIHEQFPFLKGKELRVNFDRVLNPMIHVTGDVGIPKVGIRYSSVVQIPQEHTYSILKLLGMVERYPNVTLYLYHLWKRVSQIFPDIDCGEYMIRPIEGIGVFLTRDRRESEE